jgi:hypothetical protein
MGIPIKIKRTSTADTAPATTDLELGELAINTNDGKLFFKQDRNGVDQMVLVILLFLQMELFFLLVQRFLRVVYSKKLLQLQRQLLMKMAMSSL